MKLKPGDVVDIIAPSSFPETGKWKKGLQILQSWGLRPRFPEKALAVSPKLWHANSDKKRSYFLNRAFADRDSTAVWMARGGYGLQKLMPSFVQSYSKNPVKKLFIGYSDGCALHFYLNGQNQVTLQAPHITELPDLPQKELTLLKSILFGIKKEIVFENLKATGPPGGGTLKAPVRGGNLSLLSSSVGTVWLSRFNKPCFLFIEDINEEDHKFDRMLRHLFYAGILKNVKALLFGVFCPEIPLSRRKRILKSFSEICPLPLIFGLPCGHTTRHHPLPFNIPAELFLRKDQAKLKINLLKNFS